MTTIYFVRHAEPVHGWADDRTRPLTREGEKDSVKVTEVLHEVAFDYAVSSPYKRSIDTIKECAIDHGIIIETDERFREREKGKDGNVYGMFQKRWADFDFREEGGESLRMVQKRNMEGLKRLLWSHNSETILFGTHGTAFSTILNYYDPSYDCNRFLKIIDYMPYVVKMMFHGTACIGKEEILIIKKEFTGEIRANKV
ncbi:MAG: histidine phosphatase family protein [bacterium]|nr:histidine phosphatase family protein [bacterium]